MTIPPPINRHQGLRQLCRTTRGSPQGTRQLGCLVRSLIVPLSDAIHAVEKVMHLGNKPWYPCAGRLLVALARDPPSHGFSLFRPSIQCMTPGAGTGQPACQ